MPDDRELLIRNGYEPRPHPAIEGVEQRWWRKGEYIGRTPVAAQHCHTLLAEIARASAFLCNEGYLVITPEERPSACLDRIDLLLAEENQLG